MAEATVRMATEADVEKGYWLCCQAGQHEEKGIYYEKHVRPPSLSSLPVPLSTASKNWHMHISERKKTDNERTQKVLE